MKIEKYNKSLAEGELTVKGISDPYSLFEYKQSQYPIYNASWLQSNGQFNLATIYPSAYEALVIEQDSTKTAGTSYPLPSGGNYVKRGLSVKLSTASYTDYDFVINTENQTFRLPNKVQELTITQSTVPVVGNGKSLGWSDGSTDYGTNDGIKAGVRSSFFFNTNSLGLNVGTPVQNGTEPSNNIVLGITQNPNNSGLVANIPSASRLLYFYVGNNVQSLLTIEAQADAILAELSKRPDFAQLNTKITKCPITSSNYINVFEKTELGATQVESASNKEVTYTLPSDGYMFVTINNDKNQQGYTVHVRVNNMEIAHAARCYVGSGGGSFLSVGFIGRKGDVLRIFNDLNTGTHFGLVYGWFYAAQK